MCSCICSRMHNILEFSTDHTFQEWLHENQYTKDDDFASVWNHEGKCVAGTHEKHERGKRMWQVTMYI